MTHPLPFFCFCYSIPYQAVCIEPLWRTVEQALALGSRHGIQGVLGIGDLPPVPPWSNSSKYRWMCYREMWWKAPRGRSQRWWRSTRNG